MQQIRGKPAGRTALPLRSQLVREHPQAKRQRREHPQGHLRIFRHQREQRIRRKEQGFHIVHGHGGRGERPLLEHCGLADRVPLTDKVKHHLPPVGSEPDDLHNAAQDDVHTVGAFSLTEQGRPARKRAHPAPRSETFPLVRGQRLKQRQAPEHFQPFV